MRPVLLATLLACTIAAPAVARDFVKEDFAQSRAYSLSVTTQGGKTVYLAGQASTVSLDGKKLAGDFDGQARDVFARLSKTLEQSGGKLSDMTSMTVFITDTRNGTRLTEIRKEVFGDNFPGSALITVGALANPAALIEIQGVAVVGAN
jgi:2-iminobutanoate/2-iminopropanoate deaminase